MKPNLLFIPLMLFIGLTVFLGWQLLKNAQGDDPRRLESALIGTPVPVLYIGSLDEKQSPVSQARFRDGQPWLINFWATWCPPCIAEMPSVNELYEKLQHNKNIVFIMVDADHDFSKSVPFMNKHQFTLPLYEANSVIPENLLGGSIPTTVIFDKNGQLVFHHEGAGDYRSVNVADYLLKLSR